MNAKLILQTFAILVQLVMEEIIQELAQPVWQTVMNVKLTL